MRVIVSDTGPLLHLSEAGALHLLQQAGELIIPPIVADEFEKNAQGWLPPQWVEIQELDTSAGQKSAGWIRTRHIDAGEAAAIALAIQKNANWLLTDDAKARQFADSLGLEVHGAVGLLLWNVVMGYIRDAEQALRLLDALANSSLWISERVLGEARKAIMTLLSET